MMYMSLGYAFNWLTDDKKERLVVWKNYPMGVGDSVAFEGWLKESEFAVTYKEAFKTKPTSNNSSDRWDLIFAFNNGDIEIFNKFMSLMNMMWWESYLDSGEYVVVPDYILKKYPYGWNNTPNKYVSHLPDDN